MAIALAGVVAVYTVYRRGTETGADLLKNLPSGASLTIENLRQTAAREGKTEWTLDAARARMSSDRKSATLEKVSVVFFVEDGDEVHLTADAGLLKIRSNDLEVSGNVVVWQGGYRLTCERLEYHHRDRVIVAEGPVSVAGKSLSVDAEEATFDIESKRLRFKGNVYGTIVQALEM
jgi:LPS export ABC transporter protein LptC